MAWGGGLLEQIGLIDFAGGNVIHISTGVSGLVAALFLGKRKGYGAMSYHPHNIPLFLIGNWRINFMGRLVLLQLWLCRWRKWNCNFGVCKHSFILGNKYGRLDGNRVDYTKKVYCNGYNDGHNCWFGWYHSRCWLCATVVVYDYRRNGGTSMLLCYHQNQTKIRL